MYTLPTMMPSPSCPASEWNRSKNPLEHQHLGGSLVWSTHPDINGMCSPCLPHFWRFPLGIFTDFPVDQEENTPAYSMHDRFINHVQTRRCTRQQQRNRLKRYINEWTAYSTSGNAVSDPGITTLPAAVSQRKMPLFIIWAVFGVASCPWKFLGG